MPAAQPSRSHAHAVEAHNDRIVEGHGHQPPWLEVPGGSEVVQLPYRMTVCRWADPVVETLGLPVNSIYSETVLLPVVGPSSVLCLRRLSAWVSANPDGVQVDTRQLARDLGLGDSLGRNGQITRTIHRLCQFDLTRW